MTYLIRNSYKFSELIKKYDFIIESQIPVTRGIICYQIEIENSIKITHLNFHIGNDGGLLSTEECESIFKNWARNLSITSVLE